MKKINIEKQKCDFCNEVMGYNVCPNCKTICNDCADELTKKREYKK